MGESGIKENERNCNLALLGKKKKSKNKKKFEGLSYYTKRNIALKETVNFYRLSSSKDNKELIMRLSM